MIGRTLWCFGKNTRGIHSGGGVATAQIRPVPDTGGGNMGLQL